MKKGEIMAICVSGECGTQKTEVASAELIAGNLVVSGHDSQKLPPPSLYRTILDSTAKKQVLATVLDGAHVGEKLLLLDGVLRYCSRADGLLAPLQGELAALGSTGVYTFAGAQVFVEQLTEAPKLVLCGAGAVSVPVIALGKKLGFYVTVLEENPEFADGAVRAGADCVRCDSSVRALATLSSDADTYFVVGMRGNRSDTESLREILKKEHAYVGMMGSHSQVASVLEKLAQEGFDKKQLSRVHAPIGSAGGAQTPQELAVLILAQVVQCKNAEKQTTHLDNRLLHALVNMEGLGHMCAIAVVTQCRGPASCGVGARMLIFADGSTLGTIGGGCVEQELIDRALLKLREDVPQPELFTAALTDKDAADAGTVTVYLESCCTEQ